MSADRTAYYRAYDAEHKEERSARARAYYAKNRDEILAQHRAYSAKHKDERRALDARYHAEHRELDQKRSQYHFRWLRDIKRAQGCMDCGAHEGPLVHHHVDPARKRYNVSRMVNFSLESILDEIARCTVLCRSCHAKRHLAMGSASGDNLRMNAATKIADTATLLTPNDIDSGAKRQSQGEVVRA